MALLESLFNHLVLPPKLPGQQDADIESIGDDILTRLIHSCDTLRKPADQELADTWASIRLSLRVCLHLHQGRLEKDAMLHEFRHLQPNRLLIFYLAEQNAALLVRRPGSDDAKTVIFEAFEVSPTSTEVLAAAKALQWDFPGRAAQIPIEEFLNPSFQESLAGFLEKANMESLKRFEARATKTKVAVVETRDTTNPILVTHMLMSILEAVGSVATVPRIRKRVRDDVNIQKAELPWRRLPFWLVLRVATQRHLHLALGDEAGRACYKFLIATILAELLKDCAGQLAPELTVMLKAKLCRRLAKLEMEKTVAPGIYEQLFRSHGPNLKTIIKNAAELIQLAWQNFMRATTRPVPKLPARCDEQSLYLSLPNSRKYLRNILDLPLAQQEDHISLQIPRQGDGTIEQVRDFTDLYFNLAKLESEIQMKPLPPYWSATNHQACCEENAETINNLFTAVGGAYDSNPEQTSTFILTLFGLWVRMDECAVKACPLLLDYHPVFSPELLDVLHLPMLSDMQRLQDIQKYLLDRSRGCRSQKTIFSEPGKNCFASEYLDRSTKLRVLRQQIENDSNRSREEKTDEWERACEEYEKHSDGISSGTCVCSFDRFGERNVRGCTKCWHWRSRNRMKITAHEDFLPDDHDHKAAVVFELGIPSYLSAYRNATWKILSLGHPSKPKSALPPVKLLKDHYALISYNNRDMKGVTLASVTKSFLQTHYKSLKMKVGQSDVLLPLGLRFSYYDMMSETWVKDLDKTLTFQHLCGIHVPSGLRASVMRSSAHPSPVIDGPSSYKIVASQTKCPPDMSVHEFMAYQRLLSGKSRRWLAMLVELGASDLNFSTEDTMSVFSHLAVQAGPAQDESSVFRDIHLVFKDQSFCQRLTEQIENRLRNIASNWRETPSMEMLITLSLRLYVLASDRHPAARLLQIAQDITSEWITRLRDEVRNAVEAPAAQRAAMYGFWASLLCRRTFTTFMDSDLDMSADELSSFVQASMGLQENLVVDLAKLPQTLKNMLVRDVKMAYRIQPLIRRSIQSKHNSLAAAINKSWSDSGNSSGRTFSSWQFNPAPHERWVSSIITTMVNKSIVSQVVHYNFVEGHLLVNGKPLGKLPRDIRQSEEVKELFGNQHLLTFPSPLSGMTHVMATRIYGHEIHFGMRGDQVVIRAVTANGLLEYVPARVFRSYDSFDLPLSLIDNCAHWLNIKYRCLEIRRKPVLWKTRQNDWIVNVSNHRAKRSNRVSLVDPHSDIGKRVAGIFRHFEDPERLTVFQPDKLNGTLSVELRNLGLSFFVNKKGFLECRELNEEVDPNQDAGTLYGFESKIVLRDVANIEQRSIITALGELTYKRHGMHVSVCASSVNNYGRFGIDSVLGRLSCPPEPRLLYSKAKFHAYTSFVLPDPLTGRTGTEEALHTLTSGYCQPWTPLTGIPASILESIRKLSPRREYYPKDKRRLQTVSWDPRLTMSIQHDSYDIIVQGILRKSDNLQVFAQNNEEALKLDIRTPSHLQIRGEVGRHLYECTVFDTDRLTTPTDTVYEPRDRMANSSQAVNVYQIVRLIRREPFSIYMRRDLSSILQDWRLIGGFHITSESNSGSLTDLIDKSIDEQWGSLVEFCRCAQDSYSLMFRLSLLSMSAEVDIDVIKSLAAFGCIRELKALKPPSCPSFVHFKLNAVPTVQSLFDAIAVDFPVIESTNRRGRVQLDPAREKLQKSCMAEGRSLAEFLSQQWPNLEPTIGDFESTAIDTELAMERVLPEWRRLHQNMELSEYLVRVQKVLHLHKGAKDNLVPQSRNQGPLFFRSSDRGSIIPSVPADLLVKSGPPPRDHTGTTHRLVLEKSPSLSVASQIERDSMTRATTPTKDTIELEKILTSFAASPDMLRQRYGNDLKTSLIALKNVGNQTKFQQVQTNIEDTTECMKKAWKNVNDRFESIQKALSAEDDRFQWLEMGNLWPCTTTVTVLEQLRSGYNYSFGNDMKEAIVSYGIQVTTLQQLLRIKDAQLSNRRGKVLEEVANAGHENWDPLDFSDWLLLEIDSNILIRREQIDVAHAIMFPESGSNSVTQLNMGKGKTYCIVPMSVAVLANEKQLSRLIVPKALLLQTAQTLQSRIGGLVGREIRHVPFSRRTMTTTNMLRLYSELHREMLHCRGVILNAPEHILSYKLSGLQHLADSKLEAAREMVQFQSWLTATCRDVLDESDFTLAVKTQLIYPSGPQISVDGHPHRWEVAQMLLSLVEGHLPDLQRAFPRSIEVVKRPHGFPMVHFLQNDVEDDLHQRIVNDICSGRTSFLRFKESASLVSSDEIKSVLMDEHLDNELFKRVTRCVADKNSASKKLLLVRGLLLNRILLLCLKKRWNVQYGLHPDRYPIAVPFEAKGVPSEQAEFGHPDVAILFTCLAFYYSGLNYSQFCQGLQRILKSHDPPTEYDKWTSASDTLPEALHHWNVINIDEQGQVEELWRHLRLSRNVLDHYMNNFVFPVHAKQFGIKLQASGWDLPLFSTSQIGKNNMTCAKTTGFSGTNDNKMMLPLTIRQDDLPSLRQTNAEVLTYLLQNRNRSYIVADSKGKRLTEEGLLWKIAGMQIRILIDAGAYVLEMSNENLVKKWLEIDTKAQVAVFFGADNRAWVQYRGGKEKVPLLATAFAEKLDDCLVYLDEAHTRGVDLKLPQNACGALTLALGQTKDHTVQAAMRLRQLGSTQSVVFFAPPEVHQSILDVCNKSHKEIIDSSHVVHWLLEQTCRANEQLHNLYIAQGTDFCHRTNAQWENAGFLTDRSQTKAFLKVVLRAERQTLEQLYGSMEDAHHSPLTNLSSPAIQDFIRELSNQRKAVDGNGNIIHSSALEEVEQEREVEFQVEEVRQVQSPAHYKALLFPGLHAAISTFAKTGVLVGESGYEQAFDALARTGVGQKYKVQRTASRLFVSAEFMRTIDLGHHGPNDNFLRPVEWILWNASNETALVVISEEVELLIPILRSQKRPRVYLITYAASITKNMLHFSDLSYYVLPRLPDGYVAPEWLSIELGIFAGRLYMNFAECSPLIKYLQLVDKTAQSGNGQQVKLFTQNPIGFLLEWLAIRRKGQDVMHTPIGYICQGRPLHENHPFFVSRRAEAEEIAECSSPGKSGSVDVQRVDEGYMSSGDEWDKVDQLT